MRAITMALHGVSIGRACSFGPTRRGLSTVTSAAKTSMIKEIQSYIRSKKRSVTEIVQHYLDTIQRTESQVNSFLTVDSESALSQAKAVDTFIAKHGVEKLGPLAGVPSAIKDNICTKGLRTTAGSRMLDSYVPTFDATATAKLRAAGAVVIGKTNMDEFGMGSSTENSAFKKTYNPWDTERVPGGSSGGSAAAVAAGQCAVALGTDTGGSIRQPAHFCGVVGLKPTYGRVSRYGLVAYASSLDSIGPMAHTVEDAALVLNAIAGVDTADSTSTASPSPIDFAAGLLPASALSSAPLKGKRLGLIKETMGEGVAPEVVAAIQSAAKHMESLGAVVEEVSLPTYPAGLPAYYVLAVSEASSNLARYDGVRYGMRAEGAEELQAMYAQSRGAGLGAEVKRRVLMGTYALSAGYYDAVYKRAQQVRTLVGRELGGALSRYDALLCPAASTLAYKVGEKVSDPLAMYSGDLATVNINLAGLPAIVLPCGHTQTESGRHLPMGLQIVGREWDEAGIIGLAHVFEATWVCDPQAKPMVA